MKQTPEKFLKSIDPILGDAIERIELKTRKRSSNHFRSLVESIISQQLSVKASDTIFTRFVALFAVNGKIKFPTPDQVLKMPETKLRGVGLSNQKVKYVKHLAEKIIKKELALHKLKKMSDEEVIEHLIQVKGIGRWTGEMFLMFSLARPDVFSHGDLGLRNAIKKLYGFKQTPTTKQVEKIVQKWAPHRTLASRYLWKSLDNE